MKILYAVSLAVAMSSLTAVYAASSAPQPASPSAASPQSSSKATPATAADRDLEALQRIWERKPPKSRDEDPRAWSQWTDQNMKDYSNAAIAFAEKYPHDPRRWEGLIQMGYAPPTFIAGFKPEFDSAPDRNNLIIDEKARDAFEARLATFLDELEATPDATDRARMGAMGLRMGAAEARAKRDPSPANRAAIRKLVDRMIDRYPDHPATAGAAEQYLDVLRAQAPQEAKSYEAEMQASKVPAIARFVKWQHDQQKSLDDIRSLKFTAVDGRKVDVGAMRGKVVLIDFWATWCTPCIAELPNIKTVYASYHQQGFEVIGVSVDNEQDRQKLLDLVKKRDLPWPQYFDGKAFDSPVAKGHLITRVPSMFLLDKQGKVASTNARGKKLESEVKRLLAL